jgi:dipeptidyl-peptidase-3
MQINQLIYLFLVAMLLTSCATEGNKDATKEAIEFDYFVEQFADIKVLHYKILGFEELTLKEKKTCLLSNASRFIGKRYYVGSKLPS